VLNKHTACWRRAIDKIIGIFMVTAAACHYAMILLVLRSA